MAKPAALDELDIDELLTEEIEAVELIDDEFELIAEETFELVCDEELDIFDEELEFITEEELELVICTADDFDEPDDEPPPHACKKTPNVKIAIGNDIAFIVKHLASSFVIQQKPNNTQPHIQKTNSQSTLQLIGYFYYRLTLT